VDPDPKSGVRSGVASTLASRTLARVSVALQRSNAMTLRTYLTDCVHHATPSVPVPPRFRRKWQPPARAGAAANAGQGSAVCWPTRWLRRKQSGVREPGDGTVAG
jgi:hypothetical protein